MGLVKLEDTAFETDTSINSEKIATAHKDTFTNRTAISPTAYPEEYGTLLSYSTGVAVNVKYYKQRVPLINRHSIETNFSLERSAVHMSYDLIHNLEIRVQDELQIDYDEDNAETNISGEAIMYSGFNPNPGDVFYYKLHNSKIGVFVVNNVTPMSIDRGTHHKVNFHLYAYLDENIDDKLNASVAEELHFHKQTYFSGEATLLKDSSYRQLMALMTFRKNAINYLMTHYYDKSEHTIIVPENIFDSFLVEMTNQIVSVEDTRTDICNLSLGYIDDFDYSIFRALLSQDATKLIYTGYNLHNQRQFVWDSMFSSIDNYRVVHLTDSDEIISTVRSRPTKYDKADTGIKIISYIFSNRFYYSILRSFEDGKMIEDIVPLIPDMEEDPRVFPNLSDKFYSTHDKEYHDLAFFEAHSKATGSNNDIHIPEIEFMVLDYLINNNLDTAFLTDKVIDQYPFSKMTKKDRLYWLIIIIHLTTVAIRRIR